MSGPDAPALCCQCGQTRTYRRARNTIADCGADPARWHRMTGDLKCAACGTVTRHALLRPDTERDYAETWQKIALGFATDGLTDAAHVSATYRQGLLPRNPNLNHCYWISDADKARQAGNTTVPTLCGDTMPLPTTYSKTAFEYEKAGKDFGKPREFHDVDREDPETGLWWFDGDCVNCLSVWNAQREKRRRKQLEKALTALIVQLVNGQVPPQSVARLLTAIAEEGGTR